MAIKGVTSEELNDVLPMVNEALRLAGVLGTKNEDELRDSLVMAAVAINRAIKALRR